MTKDELVQFQSNHSDHLGIQLVADGTWGPRTDWAWHMAHMSDDRQAVIDRAISAIGITEIPAHSNHGPNIDAWLERCGIKDGGLPWCAAFASWCLSAPGNPPIAIASVAGLVKHFPRISIDLAMPGDLGYVLRSDGTGHVWVLSGFNDGTTMQIEGNNGDAVRVTTRLASEASGYLQTFCSFRPGIPAGVPFASSQTR